jgi:hypothetical protein
MESISKTNLRPSKGKAFWDEHISSWQQSGLSKTTYCKTHGLAKSTFDCWRKKQHPVNADPASTQDFLSLRLAHNPASDKVAFPASSRCAPIEILFQQGIVIKVASPIDREALFQVLQLVRQLS